MTEPTARSAVPPQPLIESLHHALSGALRYDYISDCKGHRNSRALLAPGEKRAAASETPALQADGQAAAENEDEDDDHGESELDPALDEPDEEAPEAAAEPDRRPRSAKAEPGFGADIARRFVSEVMAIERLTSTREYQLARRCRDGDARSRQRLVEHHLGLVVMIARRYVDRGLPLLDLIEEGNLGLIVAVERFDPEVGCRFSTYARWWIRQQIDMALMTQTSVVRIPAHVARERRRAARERSRLEAAQGAQAPHVQRMEDEAPQTLEDLQLPDHLAPDEITLGHQRDEHVAEMLRALSVKERKVIALRFGLGGEDAKTLAEVGTTLGLTSERVRQIQIEALAKLRQRAERMGVACDTLF